MAAATRLGKRATPPPTLTPTRQTKRQCTSDAWSADSPLSSAASTPEPPSTRTTKLDHIDISGQRLKPTIVFDTLWKWLAERKALDDERRQGLPAPWTDDRILQEYKFCQSYRVMDKTSQFLITEVIEKGSQARDEILFRILLFQSFNRIETWRLLQKELGNLTYKDFDIDRYDSVLSKASNGGTAIFTHAYLKIAPNALDHTKNNSASGHRRHLNLLKHFMDDLPEVLRYAEYAADVYEAIAAYPGCAAFISFQILIALSYSSLINFSANDFVIPGLGCSSGLAKMFGNSLKEAKKVVPDIETDILRWMVANQEAQFDRLGITFSFLRNDKGAVLKLELPDLEHAVCEVDKYARKKHPGIKNGKAQLKSTFVPTSASLPAKVVLPKAWSHPARRRSHIRAEKISVHKIYVVESILGERLGGKLGDNEMYYRVHWMGYPKSERTWEPRSELIQDVPQMVEAWESRRKEAGVDHQQ
ncbi:Chromo domain-containing protein [Mycena indigotica]|uniref:Chromo domain-containing protein n=1 Tax=Mycena indigotica TaxID=2126181 RepID=A0A8H6TI45_9AGAR|nr:Chromo domain-containing protein [Mycena indigotica]KAF7316150.1 Chromo domain-containing protein [Mycena indigotica]